MRFANENMNANFKTDCLHVLFYDSGMRIVRIVPVNGIAARKSSIHAAIQKAADLVTTEEAKSVHGVEVYLVPRTSRWG